MTVMCPYDLGHMGYYPPSGIPANPSSNLPPYQPPQPNQESNKIKERAQTDKQNKKTSLAQYSSPMLSGGL